MRSMWVMRATQARRHEERMFENVRIPVVVALIATSNFRAAADERPLPPQGCVGAVSQFADEVWNKVAAPQCLTCHQKGGEAESSGLVLLDPRKLNGAARDDARRLNQVALLRMARASSAGPAADPRAGTDAAAGEGAGATDSRLLLKVVGQLEHGGAEVLLPESAEYRILADFVRRARGKPAAPAAADARAPATSDNSDDSSSPGIDALPPYFTGVVMLDNRREAHQFLVATGVNDVGGVSDMCRNAHEFRQTEDRQIVTRQSAATLRSRNQWERWRTIPGSRCAPSDLRVQRLG